MKSKSSLKVGISGVRGIVGDSLSPQVAARFAAAFGTYAGRARIIVGRDARSSGPMLTEAVFSALLAAGCRPVDIGICPIPTILLYVKERRALGGVAVTASHNPGEWNGLKFISGRGLYLNPAETAEFLDIYHQGDFAFAGAEGIRTVEREDGAPHAHLRRLLRNLDVEAVRKRKLRVVADCAGGAGSVLMPALLEELGCRTVLIDAVPDGSCSRPSEPTPENLSELSRTVVKNRADIGFAQDADADRLALVDEKGRPMGEDMTLALAVRRVLGGKPGPVVVNLSASLAIDDIAREAGVPVFRTKIGETHVVEELLRRKAAIGGEGNGGVVWPAVHPCRDSFAAAGLILESLAASNRTASALRRTIPSYVLVKDKVEGTPDQAHRILARLKKRHGRREISTLDGLKIFFGRSWVHVRPSNTEPFIRITAEAKTKAAAERLVQSFKDDIRELS
ncbi:MAG: phosphoglucosamine mutase [Acidobacteriota bacterium]|nr:phosphoglucosamine mutase [Acidobacteriota bacterium]